MKNLALHWKIIIGLVAGLVYGIFSASAGWGSFTSDWIAPFGTIFINLLKLIAVPLVFASLVTGVASLSDTKKLSRIGGRTITIYICTTIVSVTIGLILVNFFQPGGQIPAEMKIELQETYEKNVETKTNSAQKVKERGPLKPIVDMVPSNVISSASSNRNMLQIVFVAILVGIGLIQIPKEKSKNFLGFFEGLNDVVLKVIDMIMLMAPIGVFALIAQTINKVVGDNINQVIELMSALGFYMFTLILGLILHVCISYIFLLKYTVFF